MSKVSLCSNTGIVGDNYIAFGGIGSTKTFVDEFFNERIFDVYDNLSEIYLESDPIHHNSGCVHIPDSYVNILGKGVDYIKIENSGWAVEPDRTFYAIVQRVEQVNVNSCRLYFSVDWCATYWDQIELKPSHIVRRLEKNTDEEFENRLSEPITTQNIAYSFTSFEKDIKTIYDKSSYNLITSITTDGSFGANVVYQSGASIGGYLKTVPYNSSGVVESYLQNMITHSRALMSQTQPVLNFLEAAYVCPTEVATNNGMSLFHFDFNYQAATLARINSDFGLSLKTKKIMNYISYSLISYDGKIDFSPYDLPDPTEIKGIVRMSGGPNGKATCIIDQKGFDREGLLGKIRASSPNWPQMFFAATLQAAGFKQNTGLTNEELGSLKYMVGPSLAQKSYEDAHKGNKKR